MRIVLGEPALALERTFGSVGWKCTTKNVFLDKKGSLADNDFANMQMKCNALIATDWTIALVTELAGSLAGRRWTLGYAPRPQHA